MKSLKVKKSKEENLINSVKDNRKNCGKNDGEGGSEVYGDG